MIRIAFTVIFLLLIFSLSSNAQNNDQTPCENSKPGTLEVLTAAGTNLLAYFPLVYACLPSKLQPHPEYSAITNENLESYFTHRERVAGCILFSIYNILNTVSVGCKTCKHSGFNCAGC